MNNLKIKKLVLISVVTSLSTILYLVVQIPLFGGFMKLDFSILPALLILYLLDLASAISVLLIRSILCLLFGLSWIGVPINFVALASFLVVVAVFSQGTVDLKRFFIGGVCGTVVMTLLMLLLNYLVAIPLYEKFMNFKLASVGLNLKEWLLTMTLPFNLIQGVVFIVAGMIILAVAKPILINQQKNYKM